MKVIFSDAIFSIDGNNRRITMDTTSWMTIRELKDNYGLSASKSSFRSWCREKKLNYIINKNKCYRIDPADYEKVKELSHLSQLKDEIEINGIKYYSLCRAITDKIGEVSPDIFERKYKFLYRWATKVNDEKFKMIAIKRGKLFRRFMEEQSYLRFINLIGVNEATQIARVTRQAIYRWRKQGRLKIYSLPHKDLLIWKDDLINLLNNRKFNISKAIFRKRCKKFKVNLNIFKNNNVVKITFNESFFGMNLFDICYMNNIFRIRKECFCRNFNDRAYYDNDFQRGSGEIKLVPEALFERLIICDKEGGIVWDKE